MIPPLKFRPLLKRLRWGGTRLGTVLGKPLGAGTDYAESWELCDREDDQSIVADGPLAGTPLHELVCRQGPALLGRHAGLTRFPLLLKYLDATDRLSVQVHPNDEQARRGGGERNGKTEAWVILDATPGACVYAGLATGVTRGALLAAVRNGSVEGLLHRVPVAAGDCLFIPAGTVHAIGEGVLLAEVQQSSDTTYRLFDWNRVSDDGRPRPLHIEQALECTDFARGPVRPIVPRVVVDADGHRAEALVECREFTILRHSGDSKVTIGADGRCRALMALHGTARLGCEPVVHLGRGETILVAADALPMAIHPSADGSLLEVFWS